MTASFPLSVIVCTRNRAESLERCVNALLSVRTNARWELVIVDNASTDGTAAFLNWIPRNRETPQVTVTYQSKPGLGAARNVGWLTAKGDIVAFVDDDCYVAPDYVDAIIAAFAKRPEVGFVGGRVLLFDKDDLPMTIQERDTCVDFAPYTFFAAGDIHGANFAFRRQTLTHIEGFDENLGAGAKFAGEDVDSIARALWTGLAGAYDPSPTVFHHHGRKTDADGRRSMRTYDTARGAYYMKFILNPCSRAMYFRLWKLSIRDELKRASNAIRDRRMPNIRRSVLEIFGGLRYLLLRLALHRSDTRDPAAHALDFRPSP